PAIGAVNSADRDGPGEPVDRYDKPKVGRRYPIETPEDSDEFNDLKLGLQWQWHANPSGTWAFPFPQKGVLRMSSVDLPDGYRNLWDVANVVLKKFPGEGFMATAKVNISPRFEGERFGFVVMGMDYSMIAVTYKGGKLSISQITAKDADKGSAETETARQTI